MVPNYICINLSQSHEGEKMKKIVLYYEDLAFDQVYKKCQKRDFSIFDLIFDNLPINPDGSMIPQKKTSNLPLPEYTTNCPVGPPTPE